MDETPYLNSKSFLQKVQFCIYEDELSIMESILAVQEQFDIHFDDIVEFLKLEKTLARDLKAECISKRMMRNRTKSFDISELFK